MRSDLLFERLLHNWPAKVLSVAIAIFLFLFNRMATLEERFFSVPLEVLSSENFIPAESLPENVRVTIRGRSQEVNLILAEDIRAWIDFSDFDHEGTFSAAVQIEKKGAALHTDPIEIRVDPATLTIRFEKRMRKSVEVSPNVTGFPAKGYELGQYFLTPTTVEVEGVRSTIEHLSSVSTEDIDIGGKTEDFTVRVRLERPDQTTRFPGGDVVEFYGVVQESVILTSLENLDVIALDLDPSFELSGEMPPNQMRIQGRQLLLEGLGQGDIRFTIDCSAIERPGTYLLPLVPDVPQGILVLRYDPAEVRVDVRYAEVQEQQQ